MRLTLKLILAIGLGIAFVLAANAWVLVSTDRDQFEADVRSDHRVLANALVGGVESLAASEGLDRAQELVDAVNSRESHVEVRWVRDVTRRGPTGPRFGPLTRGSVPALSSDVVEEASGARHLVTHASLGFAGRSGGIIELVEPLAAEDDFARATVYRAAVTTGILIALCVLVLTVFGIIFVGRPLRQLTAVARSIGAGETVPRLELRQHDEIRELADEMNAMCDRLAAADERVREETEAKLAALEQLRHADRLRTVGELASGLAHELGTPMSVLRTRAQMIASGEARSERVAELGNGIVVEADRMATIIRQLLDFARRDPPRLEKIDLGRWLPEAVRVLRPLAERAGLQFSVDVPAGALRVRADAAQLQQAIANLVVNAVHATPQGGEVRVTLVREGLRPQPKVSSRTARWLTIGVHDTGAGIAPDKLSRVFEPFFTTKKAGEGTGLGLSVALEIAQEHGGFIDVQSTLGAGTTFRVRLPEVLGESA